MRRSLFGFLATFSMVCGCGGSTSPAGSAGSGGSGVGPGATAGSGAVTGNEAAGAANCVVGSSCAGSSGAAGSSSIGSTGGVGAAAGSSAAGMANGAGSSAVGGVSGDGGASAGMGGVDSGGTAGAGSGGVAGSGGSAGSGGVAGSGGSSGSVDSGGGPSCAGLPATCGPHGNASCCASSLVPGGSFLRDNGLNGTYPAIVSDFALDTYELTVGRFRRFLAAYPGDTPSAGSGKNPNNPADLGWDASQDANLPATQDALTSAVHACDPGYQTWFAGNDNLPMDCISWYVASAFCIWDGGRLPSELEWNYAAAGGSDQRPFPWSASMSDLSIDSSYAVYDGDPPATAYLPVGAESPKGDSRWGQADMGGNVWEWTQDWYAPYPATCADCATLSTSYIMPNAYQYRVFRGGSAGDPAQFLLTSVRYYSQPTFQNDVVGVRCARAPM